jgi:tetratricopeptide (TPR) repeat protein
MDRLNRRVSLAIIVTALVPAFALTYVVVDRYKHERQHLAAEWSERGQADVASHPATAVMDFQTALAYRRDQEADRLRLAEALMAAKRPAEAEAHLLTLWAEERGRGEVALDLARLAGAKDDLAQAVPYYHAAIDGAWEADAGVARRRARLELVRLLLVNGQKISAQAELIALINDLPPETDLITEVGDLLVQSGAETRAATMFQRALAIDPANAEAARLAGQVAFRAGNYRDARRLLAQAGLRASLDTESEDMRDVSGRVLSHDPGARGIGARERVRRISDDFAIARDRLSRCQSSAFPTAAGRDQLAGLVARTDADAKLRQPAMQHDPDLGDQVMSLVFEIVALPSSLCGAPTRDERALQLITGQPRTGQR